MAKNKNGLSVATPGLEKFLSDMSAKIKADMEEKIKPVIQAHAQMVLASAQGIVPVGVTSNLKNSLEAVSTHGGTQAIIKANYKRKGNHAHLIAFGHKTVNGGWVEGRDFLAIAKKMHESELLPAIQAATKNGGN